jgi:hypothetical protein
VGAFKLALDPIVLSALIGLLGIIVGVGGYALQNWQVKKARRERDELVIRREKYEGWIKVMVKGFHTVQTKKEPTSMDYKREFDEANNVLLLYGSDEVVKALQRFTLTGQNDSPLEVPLQKLLLTMRKDILDTNLNESNMMMSRAT